MRIKKVKPAFGIQKSLMARTLRGSLIALLFFLSGLRSFAQSGYFESFSTTWLPTDAVASTTAGTVDMQNGWTTRESFTTNNPIRRWDQQVMQVNDANGNRKVFRMSNALTNNTYASQVFSETSAQVAGETGSSLWNNRGTNGSSPLTPPEFGANASSNTFYTRLKFRSATGAAQTGLSLTLSPSPKQSAVRMGYLQIQDPPGSRGFDLNFIEAVAGGLFSSSLTIASGLSYTDLHTLEMGITFVDGVSTTVDGQVYGNDVVKIWLNGNLIHTGTTWESYYYLYERITTGVPRLQAVDAVMFRVAGTAVAGTSGKGFYFEDFSIGNSIPSACTNPTSGGTIAAAQSGSSPFDPVAFTSPVAPGGHSGTLEYKWQSSTTSSSGGFSDIASINSDVYNAGLLTQTTWYKRLARVSCKSDWTGAAESNVIEVTVHSSFTWNGSVSTDWNTAANWTPTYVPTSTSQVIIPSGTTHAPAFPATATLAELTVQSGSTMALASGTLTLTGNLTNNGNVTASTGKLSMAGSSAQTISGTGTIASIEVNNSAGVTITSGVGNMLSVTSTLTPTLGMLTTNGNLTLKSTVSGTTRVAQHTTSGSVSGNVTVERWVNSATGTRNRQWRMLGFPYSTAVTLSGIGGMSIDYNAPTRSMMYFSESGADNSTGNSGPRNAGYQSFTLSTQQITPGQGVMAWLYGNSGGTASGGTLASDLTITSSGELNESGNDVVIPLSYTSSNVNPGWNLVANPFASSIDWTAVTRSASVENTVYRWNPAIASWTTRNTAGGQTGDADNIIESGAAFFVRASATGQTLTVPQSAKTASLTGLPHHGRAPFRLDLPSERTRLGAPRLAGLRVKVSGQGNPLPDDIYIDVSREDATAGYDLRYDAESMGRTSGAGLSVKERDGKACAMQFDAPIKEAGSERRYYPLRVTTPAVGQTKIEVSPEGDWNPLNSVSLIDKKDGRTYLLQNGTLSHSFDMTSLKEEGRFILAINHVAIDKSGGVPGKQLRLLGNPVTTERIDLLLAHPTAKPKRWELSSMQGAKVAEGRFEPTEGNVQYGLQAPGMRASGVYVLRVEMDNGEVQTVQVMRK